MEIIIGIILILFIYLFYVFNELMKINLSVKEVFLEMNNSILKKIEISENIEQIIEEDEKFKELIEHENLKNEKHKEEPKNDKIDGEDIFQNALVEKHNDKICKINAISILIAEDDKMKDLGVSDDTIFKIHENIVNINKEKNQNMKNKEKFNTLVNKYNSLIKKVPSKYIAKILGFTKYTNLK